MAGLTKEQRAEKEAQRNARTKDILSQMASGKITQEQALELMNEKPVVAGGLRVGKNGEKVSCYGLHENRDYPVSIFAKHVLTIEENGLWAKMVETAKEILAAPKQEEAKEEVKQEVAA